MVDHAEPRVFPCRHCGAQNRLRPLDIASRVNKVRCGGCSKPFFLDPDAPFPHLTSTAYEHPLDRSALDMLRRVPGVNTVLRFILRELSERRMRMLFVQTAVKTHPEHLKPLHDMVLHGSRVLDLETTPELFVMHDPRPNAFAIGVDDPFIVLTTAMLDVLDERQILGVIGHELGHIHAGHQLYRTALYLLLELADRLVGSLIPFREAAMLTIYQALLYWNRCSELTADRAQMLVQRDFDSFVRCEMRFAAGCDYTRDLLNTEQFLIQAEEATRMQEEHILNRVYATIQMADTTHPFPVWRAGHMLKWVTEGTYLDILCGNYTRRDPPPQPDLEEEDSPVSIDRMLDELRGLLGKTGL
ncbi:M48 family metallopeptidase [Sulfidibacter corallicola]|uniref:M48 family metallopeptidase n=1 Tax=Sulfidibacter corallicola TaxID=2818388 RepID=A0A8A4TRS8_SULCO|nr:M48 family metallopeptidase [Sulfidibacter corallicola]QTD52097.1 M48 family metallopeptidase [Sulfidibacter corallicola]